MTKQQTMTELLHQFQLDIQLPEKVLSINVEGTFDNMSKDNLLLDFVNADCRMDKGYFECYVFEGENCKCIIWYYFTVQNIFHFQSPNLVFNTKLLFTNIFIISYQITQHFKQQLQFKSHLKTTI